MTSTGVMRGNGGGLVRRRPHGGSLRGNAPGGSSTQKRPSVPLVTVATGLLAAAAEWMASATRDGAIGQGLSMRSTGHVGPTSTRPSMPLAPDPGNVAPSVTTDVAGGGWAVGVGCCELNMGTRSRWWLVTDDVGEGGTA